MAYTLPLEQLARNVAEHPEKPYLHQPRERHWHTLTWGEVDEQARRIATALKSHGLEKGDRVAILAKNSAEWFIADFAIMMAGMVSVPIYATAGADTIRYVLEHSGAKAIFIGKLDDTAAAEQAIDGDLLSVSFPYPTVSCRHGWQDWLGQHEPLHEISAPQASDVVSIVYTSGSTGRPKGVVLSYLNVTSSSYHAAELLGGQEDRIVSYLPLAHITERCCVELPSLYGRGQVYFTESLATFIDDVRHARPTVFISVPRLWTKFQSQILAKMPHKRLELMLKLPILSGVVKGKIKDGLGLDQARLFGSGSAPISPGILEWFARLDINISEGWGMTETCGLSCGNNPFERSRLGTIGAPQDCVEMKLSDEGEILIRGDAVFSEYYRNPEATAESFVDGWFRTGDRGRQRDDGSWEIIGRVKEQFKTGKGKYVAPVPIESRLARNPDIEQVCVLGSGRKQPLAIVVLGEQCRGREQEAAAGLRATLEEVNGELESHERIDHIIVSHTPWSIENDLLTPTLKIKRNKLEERYGRYLTEVLPQPVHFEQA